MPRQYQSYVIEDLGKGIDTYSPDDNIAPGMLSEATNVDPLSNGTLATRKGYERYYGGIPLRVNSITHSGTTITLEFDSAQSLTLADIGQGPLLVAGTIPSSAGGTGDFSSTFNAAWYSNYSLSLRETFSSGSPATKTKTASQTGLTQENAFFEMALSDSVTDLSNTRLATDESSINKSSYQIDLDYYAASSFDGFFYYLPTPDTSGTIHVESFSSSSSVSISNATHGLSNLNFVIRCYEDDGTSLIEVEPATATIDTTTGDVDVTFATAISGRIVLYAASSSHTSTLAASAGANTLTISNVSDPFNFISIWAQNGTDLEEVTPGSISWDESTQELSISYTLGSSAETVEVYWVPAEYAANIITITDTTATSESYTVTDPQLCVWGIPHADIYKSSATQGGHVHHIDNYKSEGVEKIVCGLGGNLFEAKSYENGSSYLLPLYSLRGSNRLASDTDIAPLFATTGSTDSRTRTQITDDSVGTYATVTDVAYSGSGNLVDYTLSFTNKSGTITLGNEVSTNDKLTVQNCGNIVNNGSFTISSIVSDSSTSTVIRVVNPSISDTSFDESSIAAEANVFTDILTLSSNTVFVPGDIVKSSQLTGTHSVVVASATTLVVDGVSSSTSLSNGVNLFVSRDTDILPLKDVAVAKTDNIVRGDMLRIGSVNRRFRVKQVVTFANASVTVVVSSGVATISKANHYLNSGDKIFLYDASDADLNGDHTLTSSTTTSSLAFSTDVADGSYTATIMGECVYIDESYNYDAGPTEVAITVDGRWVPIENPGSTQARTQPSKQQHFDENTYTTQPYTKSVVVNDSMFFTNGQDEVKKVDGSNITNAGLPPFQCWAFITVDPTSSALPAGPQVDFTNADTSSTKKYFGIDAPLLRTGDRFKVSDTSEILTVANVEVVPGSPDTYRVYTVEDFTAPSADGQLTKANTYRHYIKVNLIDINNTIISGPTLGSDDLYVETYSSSSIKIKLLGLPAFAELDYDRVEIEVYRTKANTPAPFYRVYRQLVDYAAASGYITIEDTTPDLALTFADLDPTTSNLTGGELGNLWTNPPKAEAMTTADNRLVLGNISSPPLLDVTFRKLDSVASLAASDFGGGEVRLQKTNTAVTNSNEDLVFSFESAGSVSLLRSGFDFVDGDVDPSDPNDSITETDHGLLIGDRVQLTTTGTLPTGLSLATDYFVIKVDNDTIQLATSFANAVAGTQVDITAASGGGTHTLTTFSNIVVASGSFTINKPSHGLSADSWVYLFHSAKGETNLLDAAGWYRIDAVTTDTFTVLANHNRSAGFLGTTDVDAYVVSSSSTALAANRVPVWVGADGNFNQLNEENLPVEARVASRLSVAINAVMATEDSSTNYWATTIADLPSPWLLAQAGQSFPIGQIRIQQADEPNGSLTITPSGIGSNVQVFVNNLLLANDSSDTSEVRLFNSRLVYSYANFAEIFDDPYSPSGASSNVLDVNPADGQEITAAVPFFGSSAFGAAQLSQAVVVFKTNSIYLADLNGNTYQKLQTQGQGCTAPRSVAVTKNGIFFANKSGIYRLRWDMQVEWVGKPMAGVWQDDLSAANIEELAGHNYTQGRKYKLSYPLSSFPANVAVYDHTREEMGQPGSWTIYDNHDATGWCNQQSDEFWGSQDGLIHITRNHNEITDYRDDDSAISASFTLGAIHYGLPNERKVTDSVTIQYQNIGTISSISVLTEQSLSGTFNASSTVTIPSGDANATVRYSLPDRKGTHVRTKVSHSTKDEKLQVSKMTYTVKSLGANGVNQTTKFTS